MDYKLLSLFDEAKLYLRWFGTRIFREIRQNYTNKGGSRRRKKVVTAGFWNFFDCVLSG